MRTFKRLRFDKITFFGEKPFDLENWRNGFARIMMFFGILLLPLTTVTTLPVLLNGGHYGLLLLDLLAFTVLLLLFFLKDIDAYISRVIVLVILYVMMISFFVALGPTHARPGWLVMCALMAALCFGFRAAAVCTVLNAALLMIFYLLADPQSAAWQAELAAPFGNWVMFVVNISAITLLCSFPMGILLRSLDRSLKSERKSHENLEKAYGELKDEMENRKHAQTALQQSEETYRSLVDNIGIGVSMVDPGMRLLAMNNRLKQWFPGVDAAKNPVCYEVLNDPPGRDICPECPVKKTFIDGKIHELVRNLGANGNHRTWRVIASPMVDLRGRVVKVTEMIEDITDLEKAGKERERLEEQLRQAHKMEAMGTLAGGIAHEFNNVLSIILGNAELAGDDLPAESPVRENLDEIQRASLRAKDMVQQILSFARKSMTNRKPMEIIPLVAESLKMMRASIPAMIEIKFHLLCESQTVLGDPTEIHQILINLCTNAAHAMKADGGLLEVTLCNEVLALKDEALGLDPGTYIKLSVKDNGHGMQEEVRKRVFDPYFTTKDIGEGTGMGLAVVHGIVHKYGGATTVRSRIGKGTDVEVLLPCAVEKVIIESPKTEALPTGKERILLVDDEEAIVMTGKQILERLGYEVKAMTDSQKAVEHFRSFPDNFDLVITDMAMPGMAGDQLATELMKIRGDIPVLLCTGHSDRMDEAKAGEAGFRGFAMKPLDRKKLALSVRSLLDQTPSP